MSPRSRVRIPLGEGCGFKSPSEWAFLFTLCSLMASNMYGVLLCANAGGVSNMRVCRSTLVCYELHEMPAPVDLRLGMLDATRSTRQRCTTVCSHKTRPLTRLACSNLRLAQLNGIIVSDAAQRKSTKAGLHAA